MNETMTRPWILFFIASAGYWMCICIQLRKSLISPLRNEGIFSVTRNGSLPSGAPCTVALSVWGRRKSTGSVYFTRTFSPRCSPGVHAPAGEEAITRRASSASSLSGDCNTRMLLAEPSFSMVNVTTTRPWMFRSTASAGYWRCSCTHARKSLRSPPRNEGIFSTIRNGMSSVDAEAISTDPVFSLKAASLVAGLAAPLVVTTITPFLPREPYTVVED